MGKIQKRILLTGARATIALELARQFKSQGHRVYASDCNSLHICRFSNSVEKSFKTPSPRYQPDEFIRSLVNIVQEYQIDMLIPTCEEIMFISGHLDRFPKSCRVFSAPFEMIHELHSKWLFCQKTKELGFDTPGTQLIEKPEDVASIHINTPYVLKATYSRACQNLVFVGPDAIPPPIPVQPSNPWVAQEWIEGKKYCTYSIVHKGKLTAHATYPVAFTVDGSSCITFEAVDHKPILEWVTHFLAKMEFTGQVAFDFIEKKNGRLFAIECNPRATHGLHLFSIADNLPSAFFDTADHVVQPKAGTRKQLAIGMVAFGWREVNRKAELIPFRKKFFSTQDVVYSRQDRKPFFAMSLLFPMYWVKSKQYGITIAEAFTHDMEWNGDHTRLS